VRGLSAEGYIGNRQYCPGRVAGHRAAAVFGVGAMRGQEGDEVHESGFFFGREGRWACHGLPSAGGLRGGCRRDGATLKPAVVLDNGGSIVSSGSGQYQWRAHRRPRFLPDS